MRTTLSIDPELLRRAARLTGIEETTALVREGLQALIERESARRLAKLGGTEPQLRSIPRRTRALVDNAKRAEKTERAAQLPARPNSSTSTALMYPNAGQDRISQHRQRGAEVSER